MNREAIVDRLKEARRLLDKREDKGHDDFLDAARGILDVVIADLERQEGLCGAHDSVQHPPHYREGMADRIDQAIDGLPAARAAAMFNVLKYWERAGKKGDLDEDLAKCNNYVFRAVYGKFRWEVEQDGEADR